MIQNKSALLASILILIFCDPYFTWGWFGSPFVTFILKAILAYVFYHNMDIKTRSRKWLFVGLVIILFLIPVFRGSNIIGILFDFCVAFLICFIPFAKEKFAWATYNYLLTIYSVIIGISAFVWCLTLVGMVHSLCTIEPLNELKEFDYNVYPLLVRQVVEKDIPRFMGPFDEPGVVGTLSALLLVIGRFNFKDKRQIVVFLASILSLSFFFYVIAAVYYLTYTIFVNKNKTLGYIVIFLMALLVILSLEVEPLYDAIWHRFEFDSDSGTLAGDDRMSEVGMIYFMSLVGTDEFYFGLRDYEYFSDLTEGSFSIFMAVAQYGLILVISYMGLFIAYGWKYHKTLSMYILYLFVLFGTLYQRPCLFEPEYLFLLSLMAMSCAGENTLDNIIKKESFNT